MKKETKQSLIANSIKFSIGILLLLICYIYMFSHPAERISLFSGFEVIYQNAEVFFQNIFGNNGDLLKEKYNLETYYEALIQLAEEKTCVDPQDVKALHDTYDALLSENKNTLAETLPGYVQKQYEFDQKIRVVCHE